MKVFKYSNDYYGGVFNFSRSISNDLIAVSSPPSCVTVQNEFCQKYRGDGPSSIIDGDKNVAWCNLNDQNSEEAYIILDFRLSSFLLTDLMFRTACSPPKLLQVLGSNDNTNFHEICNITNLIDRDREYINRCHKQRTFRYFKLKMIGNDSGNGHRLHISEIEFFGILNPSFTCNQAFYIPHNIISLLSIFTLYSK